MDKTENFYVDQIFDLRGKVVVITGTMGQLGREINTAFKKVGCVVIGVDKEISDQGKVNDERCEYFKLDIRDEQAVSRIFSLVEKQYGRVDILINNAGVSCFEPYNERSEKSFDWVVDVNLKGTFFCMREFERIAVRKARPGAIVNIGSVYGVTSPDPRIYTDSDRRNSEIYGATKAGVIQMTRYFAVHMAQNNIRVNCVSPGGILNQANPQGEDFIKKYSYRCPMGRMADTHEVVGAILYLSSSAASYTTGQNVVVDGGLSCW